MADSSAGFEIGQVVELQDGRIATVRHVGGTHFSSGDWIGLELQDTTGKNDGAVQGERYFECEPGHGMFVRPAAATIIEQAPPKQNGRPNGSASRPRPQTMGPPAAKRQSAVGAGMVGRRQSVNPASPSPGPRTTVPSRLSRSPTKSPVKPASTAPSSGTSTPRGSAPTMASRARPSISNRQSIGPTKTSTTSSSASARTSRQSLVGPPVRGRTTTTGPSSAAKAPPNRLSIRPGQRPEARRQESSGTDGEQRNKDRIDEGQQEEESPPPGSGSSPHSAPKQRSPVLSRSSAAGGSARPVRPQGTSSPSVSSRPPTTSSATSREVEDLKTKLRMMEKKRMEDRDKLKVLERVQNERDKFEGIIQKLQSKYQPQQQEIAELKKLLKDADTRIEEVEMQSAEHDVVVEMATLDREMAEETAEVVKTELEALKQKTEELELEVEVLREENEELGQEMSPEEKTSQGWLQMERNNDRLREALLRLREMTQQQEAELQDQVKSLEEDVQELSGVKEQYESTKEKLLQTEADIDDLRQQLETALGAEDMIEELTERNMNMSEQMEELRATIEDLESLQELNDELEYNHVENEKQMQEEIDYKDGLISEHVRRSAQLEETIEDSEYTNSRFRDLVTNMQGDLEDMRASQQITETEAEELTSRSRAMMDLNMKLQVSASKTQVKTIDLELRRLDAQEAAEHLAILQLFLPESFNADRDSILALLRFKRVGFKALLLHGFVKERTTSHTFSGHEDDVFASYDILDKLTWVSAMCDRFVNSLSGCTIEQFEKFEGALYELEPVERALNGWIDGLRKDELKEKQCASELQRTMALMSHLAEVHISETLESYADDVHMRVLLMQSHLENTASSISLVKTLIMGKLTVSEEDAEVTEHLAKKADALITSSRSAKVVAGKTARSLEELKQRSLSLTLDTSSAFEQCLLTATELADYSRKAGMDMFELFSVEGRTEPYHYKEIQETISKTTAAVFQIEEGEIFEAFSRKLRSLTNNIGELDSLTADLELTIEFERPPAPWALRSEQIKSTKLISVDAEEEVRRLKDDAHERAMQLRIRDKSLEESAVKIELLEARTRDAAKKGDRINELEHIVDDGKSREKELADALETQNRELRILELDSQRWKKAASERQAVGDASEQGDGGFADKAFVATAKETDALRREIENLQSTVRFLHEDNARVRMSDPAEPSSSLAWLQEPLIKSQTSQQERGSSLKSEGRDVLYELLNLVGEAKVVDLRSRKSQQNKLSWRKQSETPAWQLTKQREDWEQWREWRDDVLSRGVHINGRHSTSYERKTSRRRPVTTNLTLPDATGSKGHDDFVNGRRVQIVDPEALPTI
ncbi:MAG: hypothetical protein M4579_003007 [Chaenotheca gracillima]|nr:MAG: hypothetical protein M4579_003007 [Chaenotheca gracillima]